MGVLGQYIDALPESAKDRIIEAQDWCIGDVSAANRSRCLIGHAEDWRAFEPSEPWWQPERWANSIGRAGSVANDETIFACSREFFAFRQMYPADFNAYRYRIHAWGLASESRIGSRFDRLCVRRGVAGAVRLIKQRAARGVGPALPVGSAAVARLRAAAAQPPAPTTPEQTMP